MRIYSMTATFGKLEQETLRLQPGLNRIEAPNEWGKSTWCAFLVAMLYGLDTRAKSTKTTLSEKERYAPWSGSPMAGRIDLNWNGRDITIERSTKGRIPMGDFRAYETNTGLDVPELDGTNCGQKLLGVERSVFLRAGFIRLSDLPVTDDEALRRRLNNLVTTGDESSSGDRLAGSLKELKNRIRYNRTGLLPQAEAERDALQDTLQEMAALRAQMDKNQQRLDQVEDWHILLENHRTAIAYSAAREDQKRVAEAEAACEAAQQKLEQLQTRCAGYPDRDTAVQVLAEIDRLQQEQENLEMEAGMLPEPEEPKDAPAMFAGLCGEDAMAMAKADRDRHYNLSQKKYTLLIFSIALTLLGGLLAIWYLLPGLGCAGLGAVLLTASLVLQHNRQKKVKLLEEHYGTPDSDHWMREAEAYAARLHAYRKAKEKNHVRQQEIQQQLTQLQENVQTATQGQGLKKCREDWQRVIGEWDACMDAQRECKQAEHHYQTLRAMAKTAQAPEFPDRMDYSELDTARLLSDCLAERQRLEKRLGQCQGRMEALGDAALLEGKLSAANRRIEKLNQTYIALNIAQETLTEARLELQRRFAPRIAHRAQVLMDRMTGGRYDRLRLGDDLSLRAGAGQEEILREALWRSDGTVDQLYLALRLAVSGELTPEAPLVLDDALVRFDDKRLKAALDILKEEAKQKQVILFTCQSREKHMM